MLHFFALLPVHRTINNHSAVEMVFDFFLQKLFLIFYPVLTFGAQSYNFFSEETSLYKVIFANFINFSVVDSISSADSLFMNVL